MRNRIHGTLKELIHRWSNGLLVEQDLVRELRIRFGLKTDDYIEIVGVEDGYNVHMSVYVPK
jgi:hypothetical protein